MIVHVLILRIVIAKLERVDTFTMPPNDTYTGHTHSPRELAS